MGKPLSMQIERINDLTREQRFSVIVQVDGGDNLKAHFDQASQAAAKRRAIITARDLLDELSHRANEKRSGASKRAAKRGGARASGARTAKLDLGRAALPGLLRSTWMRDRGVKTEPVAFGDFGLAVMDVTKTDLQKLNAIPLVRAVFPNRIVKRPPVSKATALPRAVLDSPGYAWNLSRTGAMACWGAYDATGEGTKVAILDTGYDPKHPDLKGKLAGFAEFDENGNIVKEGLSHAFDSDEHGSHCAGVVVGGDASSRLIGMAPKAQIYAGLVLKGGEGTDLQILSGIAWAIKCKVDVISMSLGGLSMTADVLDTYTKPIIAANQAGIPVVCAVGNDGAQTTGSPGNDIFAYTVGATDVDDRAAGFSGGRTQIIEESRFIQPSELPLVYSKPDITAPGVDIYSCVPKERWEAWNGTSMATPHVAAAIALLLSAKAPLLAGKRGYDRVNAVQTLLSGTVRELGEAGQNHRFGYGRLDVLRAMGFAFQ